MVEPIEAVPEGTIEKGQILSIENPKPWNKMVEGKRVKVHEVRSDGRIAASFVDKADIKRFSAKIFIFEREELLPKPPVVEEVLAVPEVMELEDAGKEWDKLTKLERQPIAERANLPSSLALKNWERLTLSEKDAIRMNLPNPPAVEEVKGGNPMGKVITKEEAIGLLERLSMTPEEAARTLVADEAERREIMRTVQQRVKREQNKWAPMEPREGPPLPRIFAGLRWPWKGK